MWVGSRKRLLTVSVGIAIATASLAQVRSGSSDSHGMPVDGLQISVLRAQPDSEPQPSPRFSVELRNVGDHDLILNLGTMLANGKRLYADAITLLLGFPSGSERPLMLMGPAGVAGRVDPFVVPLPVGASYSVAVELTKYAPLGRGPLNLERGSYTLQAQFHGEPGVNPNLDMKGMVLMPYWTGAAVSNRLQFAIDAP
jgi:hypothetical protein